MSQDSGTISKIKEKFYNMGFGNTPVVPLKQDNGSVIYAKLESFNKYGSVKDRAAFFMVNEILFASGDKVKQVLVEGTSGNTGIAIGNICSELKIKSMIIIPPGTFPETVQKLRESGAEVKITSEAPDVTSTENSIRESMDLMKNHPGEYVALHQHGNDMNWLSHVYTTGPEAESQIGIPDYVCICMGTGGSIMGVGRYFRDRNPGVKVVMGQSDGTTFIQGIRNYKKAGDKEIIEKNVGIVDSINTVTQQEALKSVKELWDKHGIFAGLSSGANYHCSKKLAMSHPGSKILTVFPDNGEKYHKLYLEKGIFTASEMANMSKSAFEIRDNFIQSHLK